MIGFLVAILLATLLFYNYVWKRRAYPPGPPPLPLLGNILTIQRDPYGAFASYRKRYGPVFTYWLAEVPVVAFCDAETIQATLVKDADTFAERYGFGRQFELMRGGKYGIIEGASWREQRRFALHTLRDQGMGRAALQDKILAEVDALLESMREQHACGSNLIDLATAIERTAGSVISRILFGKGFIEKDFTTYRSLINELGGKFFTPIRLMLSYLPGIEALPYFRGAYAHLIERSRQMREYFDHEITAHQRDIDTNAVEESQQDFLHAYIKQCREQSDASNFNLENMRAVVMDIFVAGQETTATTITYFIIYIMNHTEVYRKIYEEFEEKISSGRTIVASDRPQLVYFNAVIMEAQRLTNLLPLNLFHMNTKAVEVGGHHIPAKTAIQPQIASVLYDETVYEKPHAFLPERFISASGELMSSAELMPFGLGRRQCLGESLARMELFLLTANLLNQFRIEPANVEPPSMTKQLHFGIKAEPFKVRITPRF